MQHFSFMAGSYCIIWVKENVAYVADVLSGLQIINVANPANPIGVATILPHPTSSIYDCFVKDNYLLISDMKWNEIGIYDISNPLIPILIRNYAWNLWSNDMCIENGRLYTANMLYGVNILDLNTIVHIDDPISTINSNLSLYNYPNPFNPETTISYNLQQAGKTELNVYNLKGQIVRSLLNENQSSGQHALKWNGKDDKGNSVASGLYLCGISAVGKTEYRKMVLMK